LFLRASTGFSKVALIEVPDFNWLAVAAGAPPFDILAECAAFAELLESTCAPDLSADKEVLCEAEALVCEAAEVCATAVPKSKVPTKLRTVIRFIEDPPSGPDTSLVPDYGRIIR
jgi:hypothetical protein